MRLSAQPQSVRIDAGGPEMLPSKAIGVETEDPLLSNYEDQNYFLLKLKWPDIWHLHYLVSFRVLQGAVEIFGAVYIPALQCTTVVIPPWSGSFQLRVARLATIINATPDSPRCLECGVHCGDTGSQLCQQVQQLGAGSSDEAIVAFKDTRTAFGKVRSSDVIRLHCAFAATMIDETPIW